MTLNFNNLIGKLAVGSSSATKAYLGSQAVWTAGTPASLLLRFDGNFNDSSPSPLTVTETAGTLIRSTQSKFGGSSAYFDGSVLGYLRLPSDSSLNLTGEIPYTIEFWMWMESYSNNYTSILTRRVGANWQYILGFSDPTNRRLYFSATSQGGGQYSQCYSQQEIPLQQWVHIAACVSCGTAKLFIDGKLVDTQPWAIQPDNEANLWVAQQGSGGEFFNGYIDDLRIVKGLAVYTGPFIPPTSPLSPYAIPATIQREASLLLRFDGANGSTSFIDSSPVQNTITAVNNAQISTSRSKFGGASLLLSNSNQSYLEWTHNGILDFEDNEDFTIEAWIYTEGATAYSPIIDARPGSEWGFFACGVYHAEGHKLDFVDQDSNRLTTAQSVPLNEWVHVAWTKQNGTLRAFINGIQDVNTIQINGARTAVQSIARIGAVYDPTYMNGNIDDLRIIKGLAVYTGSFTPPTAPLTVLATPQLINASLVLNFDSNFNDESINGLTVTPEGNATISTTQSKFGSGSVYFNGADSYLETTLPEFVTNDFTIEMWMKRTGNGAGQVQTFFEVGDIQIGRGGLHMCTDGNGVFSWNDGLTGAIAGGEAPIGQWVHVAAVRKNGINTLYINGVSIGTSTQDFSGTVISNIAHIGAAPNYQFFWEGYIDGFRITKAALYCSNFCVPTSPPTPTAIVQQCVSTPTTTTPPPVFGCTDPGASNYNSEANSDDGSCCYDNYSNIEFVNCTGCDLADFNINDSCGNYLRTENLSASAYGYDCSTAGCIDPASLNHNPNALCDDGSCRYQPDPPTITDAYIYGNDLFVSFEFPQNTGGFGSESLYPYDTTTTTDLIFDGNVGYWKLFGAVIWHNYSAGSSVSIFFYTNYCVDGTAGSNGCSDSSNSFTIRDGNVYGCTDPNALNYDSSATADNASCCYDDYTVVEFIGCTGCNLAAFNIFDSCYANYLRTENLPPLPYGYDCSAAGCTDPNALNYDGAALCDDGTCSYE